MKIFDQLYSTASDSIIKHSECDICKKERKKTYLCAFCGSYVCKEHLSKERKDPSDQTDNFYKICETCESHYLRRHFISIFAGHYSEKKEIIQNEISKLSSYEQKIDNNDRKILEIKKEILNIANDSYLRVLEQENIEKKMDLECYQEDLRNLTQMEEYCDKKIVQFRNTDNNMLKEIEITQDRFAETKKEKADLDSEMAKVMFEIKELNIKNSNLRRPSNSDPSSCVEKSKNFAQDHVQKIFENKISSDSEVLYTKISKKPVKDKPVRKKKQYCFGFCT